MPEHGDSNKGANSGRGVHPWYGRPDVVDKSARDALTQNATDLGRIIRQTGGDRPGAYELLGTTGQSRFVGEGKMWEQSTIHVADAPLMPGHLNIVIVSGADVRMTLPATSTIREGDVFAVAFSSAGAGSGERVIVEATGPDVIGGGLGVTTPGPEIHLQANLELVLFISAAGLGGWIAYSVGGDSREHADGRYGADYAKTEPLDAFTASGSGQDQRLTASANGALQVDGVFMTGSLYSGGILVAGESGSNRQYHGVWHVEQGGDGSNPWILRRRPDMGLNGNFQGGPRIWVKFGVHEGNVFTVPSGTNFGQVFDWVVSKGGSQKIFTATSVGVNQNDYEPGSFDKWRFCDVMRLQSSAAVDITGFVPSIWPRTVVNVDSFVKTLKHQDVASTGSHRIEIAGGVDYPIPPGGSATLWHDPLSNFWRVI